MNVYAIGQSADYQRVRAKVLQFLNKLLAEVFAVCRNLACSHHTDDMSGIKRGCSSVIKQNGSIRTLAQAGWVVLVVITDTLNVAGLCKGKFLLGPLKMCIHQGQGLERGFAGIGKDVPEVMTLLEYLGSRPHLLEQQFPVQKIQAWNKR